MQSNLNLHTLWSNIWIWSSVARFEVIFKWLIICHFHSLGKYICEFQQKSVKHQAHAFLDVALLPVIDIYTKPQFPNCKEADEVNVKVTCAITNTTEPYTVTWEDPDFIPEDISKLIKYNLV